MNSNHNPESEPDPVSEVDSLNSETPDPSPSRLPVKRTPSQPVARKAQSPVEQAIQSAIGSTHVVAHGGHVSIGAPIPSRENLIWQGRASVFYYFPKLIASFIWMIIWAALAKLAGEYSNRFLATIPAEFNNSLKQAGVTPQQIIHYLPWPLYFFMFLNLKNVVYRIIEYLNTRFTFTTQRLKVREGIFSIRTRQIELFRLKDLEVSQSFWGRLCCYAHIEIVSTDKIISEHGVTGRKTLWGVPGGEAFADEVRHAAQHARAETGMVNISE